MPRAESQERIDRARWERYAETRAPELREELILQYMPLVGFVLARVAPQRPRIVDYDDVRSAGTIGLIEAVERFDPAHGVKFETYAIARIRGSILDSLRSLDHLSRSVRRKVKHERAVRVALASELGRIPTDDEVAQAMGLTPDAYRSHLVDAAWTTTSLDTLGSASAGYDASREPLAVADPDAVDVEGEVEQQDQYREVDAAVQTLPEREQRLITLHYRDELTLREVSKVLGVSESRVGQLHARALAKLHASMSATGDQRAA